MKNRILLFATIVAALTFSSCGDDEDEAKPVDDAISCYTCTYSDSQYSMSIPNLCDGDWIDAAYYEDQGYTCEKTHEK